MDRYQRLGDLQDLETALQTMQKVVELTPHKDPNRATLLQNLAVSLTERYKRLRNPKDLETSLQKQQEAVDLTADAHPNRALQLQSLATSLRERYHRLRDLKDFEVALWAAQEALDMTPPGNSHRPSGLRILAVILEDQYQRLGDLKDLDAAVQKMQQAVDLTPSEHPKHADFLQILAALLAVQYQRLQDPKVLEGVHTCYSDSFKSPSSSPEISWQRALDWATFSEEFQPSFCVPAYQAAFALLPEILWIGNSIPVRQNAIRRLDIPDATSRAVQTCINLPDLHIAIELLEQGLATIFHQMLQLKTDVDALSPGQARQFLNLSSQLYLGEFTNPIDLVEDRNRLLANIRKQPGFEYFLLPKSYSVLCNASEGGPVVILTSHSLHCDAIIIPSPTAEPAHVLLPNVTLEGLKSQRDMLKELLDRCNVRNRGQSSSSRLFGRREQLSYQPTQECFNEMLNWLWSHVVSFVYQVLKSVSGTVFPSLSQLIPLHLLAWHFKGQTLVVANRCFHRTAFACKPTYR
jgi:tetratricopeptide (TPR) repeat protein